jgi:hypothetical protein
MKGIGGLNASNKPPGSEKWLVYPDGCKDEIQFFVINGSCDEDWPALETYLKSAFGAKVVDRPFSPYDERCNLEIQGVEYRFIIDNMNWIYFCVHLRDEPSARAFALELNRALHRRSE